MAETLSGDELERLAAPDIYDSTRARKKTRALAVELLEARAKIARLQDIVLILGGEGRLQDLAEVLDP